MTVGVRIMGQGFQAVAEVTQNFKTGSRKAFMVIGQGLRKSANTEILKKPKHGRTYIRRDRAGRRRRHVASAPGETNANMTGTLRKSLGYKTGGGQLEFGFGVSKSKGAPAYARAIEFGSRKRKIKARKTLQNAIKDQFRNMQVSFRESILDEF
jgi:hypothetical protein